MSREGYLEYIRVMHDRLAQQANQTGITTWAVLAAFVYVLWSSIPIYGKLSQIPDWQPHFVILSAHLLAIVDIGYVLSTSLRGKSAITRFDYRVSQANTSKLYLIWTICFLTAGVTGLLSALALWFFPPLDYWHSKVLGTNRWVFIGVFVLAMFMFSYEALRRIWSDYPNRTDFNLNPPASTKIAGFAISIFLLILFVSNIYYLGFSIRSIDAEKFEVIATAAVNFSIIIIATRFIVTLQSLPVSLDYLVKLERDIVLHDLSVEEIKNRLTQDYLGAELGGWLKQRVTKINVAFDELSLLMSTIDERLKEIDTLNPDLKYEIRGRVEVLINELGDRNAQLGKLIAPFNKWAESVISGPTDPYVRSLLSQALRDVKTKADNSQLTTQDTLKKLRERISAS